MDVDEVRKAYLVRDVRPRVADVAVHLAHDADVLVAVEQGVLVLGAGAMVAGGPAVDRAVGFEARVRQHHDQPLRVLVRGRDRDVLLGDELGELGRREGLRS